MSILFHLIGLLWLLLPPLGTLSSVHPSRLKSSESLVREHRELVELDIAYVVGTVAGRDSRGSGIAAQFRRSGRESKVGRRASLILVDGSSVPRVVEPLSGAGETFGSSKLYERRLSFSRCTDTPIALSDTNSWRYQPFSPFTCKIMEGMCAAVEDSLPTYVAVVSEESLLRWDVFLDTLSSSLPGEKLIYTKSIPAGEHQDGLPPHHYNPSHVGWYRLPTFNNSVVFSRDVASTLCKLYRAGPMVLYGPPELWLGQVFMTLEMLNWVEAGEGENVGLENAKPGCDKGVTLVGFKTQRDWDSCPS